jgi:hypothetical protein
MCATAHRWQTYGSVIRHKSGVNGGAARLAAHDTPRSAQKYFDQRDE